MSTLQDAQDVGEALRRSELVDLLNEKTIEFLRTISKKSPETTVFVAYAHDNHEEGTASAPQVQGIIRLLNKIGVITVTDLTRELSSTTGRRETNANRDVLQDQFCLLPNDADRRNRHFLSSVSHVVICGSELLGTYCSSPLAIEYFRCLRECYNESTATHKSFTDIKSNLLDVMKDFQERKGFHHVLTEIAFSEIRFERAAEFGVDHGIVPLVMNGQDVNYIPFCAKSEPIRIAFQRPSSLPLPPSQARMKATLKILGHIYNLPNTQVKCVEEFYDECVGQLCHLSNSGGTSATADFILTESRTTQNELHTIMQKEMEDWFANFGNLMRYSRLDPTEKDRFRDWISDLNTNNPNTSLNSARSKINREYSQAGEWILANEKFLRWKNGTTIDDSRAWLQGDMGTGKTIIMSTIVKHFEYESSTKPPFGFFFCSKVDTRAKQDQLTIFRSILRQLTRSHMGLEFIYGEAEARRPRIIGNRDTWKDQASLEDKDVQDILVKYILHNTRRTFLVFDALDELEVDCTELIYRLDELIDQCKGNCRVMISGRPGIGSSYEKLESDWRLIQVSQNGHQDMERFITGRLESSIFSRTGVTDEIKRVISESYLRRAGGMFRWVELSIDHLTRSRRTGAELVRELDNMPVDVNTMYYRIFDEMVQEEEEDQLIALRALTWLLGAVDPLGEKTFIDALTYGEARDMIPKHRDVIFNACRGLVVWNSAKDTFSFGHASVVEYLQQTDLVTILVRIPGDGREKKEKRHRFANAFDQDAFGTPMIHSRITQACMAAINLSLEAELVHSWYCHRRPRMGKKYDLPSYVANSLSLERPDVKQHTSGPYRPKRPLNKSEIGFRLSFAPGKADLFHGHYQSFVAYSVDNFLLHNQLASSHENLDLLIQTSEVNLQTAKWTTLERALQALGVWFQTDTRKITPFNWFLVSDRLKHRQFKLRVVRSDILSLLPDVTPTGPDERSPQLMTAETEPLKLRIMGLVEGEPTYEGEEKRRYHNERSYGTIVCKPVGANPFFTACCFGLRSYVLEFIDRTCQRTKFRGLFIAAKYHHKEIVDICKKRIAADHPGGLTPPLADYLSHEIHVSVNQTSLETLKLLWVPWIDVETTHEVLYPPDQQGRMKGKRVGLLHQAILHDCADGVIEFLISKGADVNREDSLGRTPLFWYLVRHINRLAQEFRRILEVFGRAGATTNVVDKRGMTPLHDLFSQTSSPCDSQNLCVLNELYSTVLDHKGRTPFYVLLQRQVQSAAEDRGYRRPIHTIKHISLQKLLNKQALSLLCSLPAISLPWVYWYVLGDCCNTLKEYLAQLNSYEDRLLKYWYTTEQCQNLRLSPLGLAALLGNLDMVQLLMEWERPQAHLGPKREVLSPLIAAVSTPLNVYIKPPPTVVDDDEFSDFLVDYKSPSQLENFCPFDDGLLYEMFKPQIKTDNKLRIVQLLVNQGWSTLCTVERVDHSYTLREILLTDKEPDAERIIQYLERSERKPNALKDTSNYLGRDRI